MSTTEFAFLCKYFLPIYVGRLRILTRRQLRQRPLQGPYRAARQPAARWVRDTRQWDGAVHQEQQQEVSASSYVVWCCIVVLKVSECRLELYAKCPRLGLYFSFYLYFFFVRRAPVLFKHENRSKV